MAKGGIITKFEIGAPISCEDAFLFWVEYMQALHNPDLQCSDNNPPTHLRLMALGLDGSEPYSEVNLFEDPPSNTVDGKWTAFQIWD